MNFTASATCQQQELHHITPNSSQEDLCSSWNVCSARHMGSILAGRLNAKFSMGEKSRTSEIHKVYKHRKSARDLMMRRLVSDFEFLPVNDISIQSLSKARRYMRRGSRAPSMLSARSLLPMQGAAQVEQSEHEDSHKIEERDEMVTFISSLATESGRESNFPGNNDMEHLHESFSSLCSTTE